MIRREHPLRRELSEELHARPFVEMPVPGRMSFLGITGSDSDDQARHLIALCEQLRVKPPSPDATHFTADFGEFHLHFERHSEFCTYKFIAAGCNATRPFSRPAIASVPADWWEDIPGEVVSAGHIAVATDPAGDAAELLEHFDGHWPSCSAVMGGRARTWTDFRVHYDGFSRVLVDGTALAPQQAGRLVQRLQELEVYRVMAMLALPLALEARGLIKSAESRLADLVMKLSDARDGGDDRSLLHSLTQLANDAEVLGVRSNYRFGATTAYYALVRRRLEELREQRVEGMQPLGQFLRRRLTPAMDTCNNAAARQADITHRIAQVTELLTTRVSVAQERQNQALLESMNRRAQLQIRLQRAVEGLSVAAITYYLLSICSYALSALEETGMLPISAKLATGLLIPLMAGLVWVGVKRVRHALTDHAEGDGD